jgi:hypothetical protein
MRASDSPLTDVARNGIVGLLAPPFLVTVHFTPSPNDSPVYDPDAYARGSVWALGTADAITAS